MDLSILSLIVAALAVAVAPLVCVHSRVGVEGWYASLFGPYNHPGKAQARLVTALWEYAFSPGQRVNPYAVVGVGVTQYRDWYLDFGPVPGSPGWVPIDMNTLTHQDWLSNRL